nr:hypothetical protein [Tanacetum cinerariifolium]
MGTHDDKAGSSRSKRPRQHETVEEDVMKRMGCNGEIDDMLRIKLHEVGSDEEIFTSVAWIISFNINEPIYAELYHEFYSTYGFDEVCADDELGLYQAVKLKEEGLMSTLKETMEHTMMRPDHEDLNALDNMKLWKRFNTRLAQLLPRHVYSSCVVNWHVLNKMGCDGEIDDMLRIRLREAESNEEISTSVAWIRAFNINEPIYAELCHEFYLTFEFDEVCADNELQTKKIIKFRLGGRAHNLTLLDFARRLGLDHADELEEDDFNIYFCNTPPNVHWIAQQN